MRSLKDHLGRAAFLSGADAGASGRMIVMRTSSAWAPPGALEAARAQAKKTA